MSRWKRFQICTVPPQKVDPQSDIYHTVVTLKEQAMTSGRSIKAGRHFFTRLLWLRLGRHSLSGSTINHDRKGYNLRKLFDLSALLSFHTIIFDGTPYIFPRSIMLKAADPVNPIPWATSVALHTLRKPQIRISRGKNNVSAEQSSRKF